MTSADYFVLGMVTTLFIIGLFRLVMQVYIINEITKAIKEEFKRLFGKWLKK